MTLATFFADLSATIARGSSQDSKIPRWVRLANNWLETNYDFQHMERTGEVYLDPAAAQPNMVDLPNNRVKMVTLVLPYKSGLDGSRMFLKPVPKISRSQLLSIGSCAPAGWWQTGLQLAFDSKPTERFNFELDYLEYTAWPTADTATPTMLARYEYLLFATTLALAYKEMKDEGALQVWTMTRNEALQPVLQAEEEAKWKGRDLRMGAG